jgi:hypothetical protein
MGTVMAVSCRRLFMLSTDAYKRTKYAATDRTWDQPDAIAAVIIAVVAVEAFINEIAQVAADVEQTPGGRPPEPPAIAALAARVQATEAEHAGLGGHAPTKEKLRIELEALSGGTVNMGITPYQEFALLIDARDALVHTQLDVRTMRAGSIRSSPLFDVVQRLRPLEITGNDPGLPVAAIDYLSTRAVARWACNTAASVVQKIIARVPDSGSPVSFRRGLDLIERTFLPVTSTSERTPIEQARAMQLWEDLRPHLEALKVLKRDLMRRPGQDVHERTRPDMVAVAIEHLEQALSALLMASQE